MPKRKQLYPEISLRHLNNYYKKSTDPNYYDTADHCLSSQSMTAVVCEHLRLYWGGVGTVGLQWVERRNAQRKLQRRMNKNLD